jgi:hypothetical protein
MPASSLNMRRRLYQYSVLIKALAKSLILAALFNQLAPGQEQQAPLMDDALPIPSSKFIPPPPPKEVPSMVIVASTARKFPTHQITVLRGDASTLPDIPLPPEPQPFVPGPVGEPHYLMSFGATVYDHSLSHVTWWNPKTRESYEAWCAWDWTLLSPIPHVEIDNQFSTFCLFPSNISTGAGLRLGRDFKMPEHPDVPADTFVITKGNAEDPTAKKALTILRDYYLRHKERLILIQKAREQYQAEAAAWQAANPPKPENHTFWLKPHRGSRYLKNEGGNQ